MVYKVRPGIVLIKICDMDMLVAKREVWESCPKVRPIPSMWAGCWRLMEKGRDSEYVLQFLSRVMHKPEQDVRSKFAKMFERMYEDGFLIPEEEET